MAKRKTQQPEELRGAIDVLSLEAASIILPDATDDEHPNRLPFKAVLHQVDQYSTRPPSGSGGRVVMIPRDVAARCLPSIKEMGLNFTSQMNGHDVTKKIGVITAWAIGNDPAPDVPLTIPISPNDVVVSGHIWERDFPKEALQLQQAARTGVLGSSYEVSNVDIEDRAAPKWNIRNLTYTGAAALRRSSAAYQESRLAANADNEAPEPDKPTGGTNMNEEELKKAIAAAVKEAMEEQEEMSGKKMHARLAAMEASIAALHACSADSEAGMKMREDARVKDEEASRAKAESMRAQEEAAELRSQHAEGEMPEELKKKIEEKEQQAAASTASYFQARAEARDHVANAYGFRPMLHAVAGLITDVLTQDRGRLATDTAARVGSQIGKLVTDAVSKSTNGGPMQAAARPVPPMPERKTPPPIHLSASSPASSWLSKYQNEGRASIRESEIDQALAAAGCTGDQQMQIKLQLGAFIS